jgi:hypothetical protein
MARFKRDKEEFEEASKSRRLDLMMRINNVKLEGKKLEEKEKIRL